MNLSLISLVNYKNHENLKLKFSKNINCFLGYNGVGKTNLLDAIHYLSFCKSYFKNNENLNIKHGENFFMINGDYYDSNNDKKSVKISFINNKKIFSFNNKKYVKLSNHIGKIPLIIITPLDTNVIIGGGEDRRRFFDKFLSQYDQTYIHNLISYNNALRQRNNILKNNNFSDPDLLNSYDLQLVNYGNKVFERRKKFIKEITGTVQKYYEVISTKNEIVDIAYKSQLASTNFKNLLVDNRKKDFILKHTSCGIHRDDFDFKIDGFLLKKTGSQGQQKSFLISLKFAYFELLKKILNIKPILLLDDIFDKLDLLRVKQIIKILNEKEFGQIFISDTSKERIDSVLSKVEIQSKYFIIKKNGIIDEELKN